MDEARRMLYLGGQHNSDDDTDSEVAGIFAHPLFNPPVQHGSAAPGPQAGPVDSPATFHEGPYNELLGAAHAHEQRFENHDLYVQQIEYVLGAPDIAAHAKLDHLSKFDKQVTLAEVLVARQAVRCEQAMQTELPVGWIDFAGTMVEEHVAEMWEVLEHNLKPMNRALAVLKGYLRGIHTRIRDARIQCIENIGNVHNAETAQQYLAMSRIANRK
jgi:hypothetical protein